MDIRSSDKHVSDEKSYNCELCSKPFKTKSQLKVHYRHITQEKPYKCDDCSKSFVQSGSLRNHHQRTHSNIKFSKCHECVFCNKSFNSIWYLNKHILGHIKEKFYNCPSCNLEFKAIALRNRHIKTVHQQVKRFQCNVCDQKFVYLHSYNGHIQIHNPDRQKTYHCLKCNNKFFSKTYLNIHEKTVHQKEKPFQCKICNMYFTAKASLGRHIRIHTNERPYSCKMCNKTFSNPGGLGVHIRLHTGEKPFKCEQCGKCFRQKGNFNTHRLTHGTELSFECKQCSKAFKSSSRLLNHLFLVHQTGRKYRFACAFCDGETFPTTQVFMAHINKHIGERPFICSVCNVEYGTIQGLAYHMKSHQ